MQVMPLAANCAWRGFRFWTKRLVIRAPIHAQHECGYSLLPSPFLFSHLHSVCGGARSGAAIGIGDFLLRLPPSFLKLSTLFFTPVCLVVSFPLPHKIK